MRSAGPAAPASRTVLDPVWSQPREECDRPREGLDAPPHLARAQVGRRIQRQVKWNRSVPVLSAHLYQNRAPTHLDSFNSGSGSSTDGTITKGTISSPPDVERAPCPRPGDLCALLASALESPSRAKSRTPTPEVPGEENRRKFGVFFCEPRNPKTETRFSQSAIGNGRSSILLAISQHR